MRAALLAVPLVIGLSASDARAQNLRFRSITIADGLTDNGITCLLEDRDGFLWIGTERGLNRFDGNLVRPVPGVADAINALAQDQDGRIWAGTEGHGLLSITHGRLERFTARDDGPMGMPPRRVHDLHTLPDGRILVAGAPIALCLLDPRHGTFTPWQAEGPSDKAIAAPIRDTWCHAIVPVDSSTLWLGMLNHGRSLVIGAHDLKLRQVLRLSPESGPNATNSRAAVVDGMLYTGGWQPGIERYIRDTWEPVTPWPTNDETADLCGWAGRLVVATKRSGLLLIDPNKGERQMIRRSVPGADGLPSDRVRCLLADRAGRLWVGTAGGLALHAPAAWTMRVQPLLTGGPDEVEVHALEPLPDGRVRACTNLGMLIAPSELVPPAPRMPEGLVITRCSAPVLGMRMLGTETGLLRVNAVSMVPIAPFVRKNGRVRTGGLENQYQVRGVFADTLNDETVWVVGALGYGIHVYRDRDGELLFEEIPDQGTQSTALALVRDLQRDPHGAYWAATDGGLVRFSLRDRASRVFDRHGDIPLHHARALHITGDTVHAVLRDGVLVRIVGDAVHVYRRNGSDAAFLGLTRDGQGRCWISTTAGVERVDPRTGDWLHVPLPGSVATSPVHGPIVCSADGRMAAAVGPHLLSFDPAVVDVLPAPPRPYLVEVTSGGRPFDPSGHHLELGYHEGVLDLRVSALMPDAPRPVRFRFRLDGVETDWRTAAAGELVRYAGLPVGTHTWLVHAVDAYGRAGPALPLLTVHVAGPFWQRWWFFALVAALLSASVLTWYRYRLAQALKLQAVRDRIASDLHDEVGSSLSSISIGARLAEQLSTSNDPQVRAILARIGATSSESLRSISDIVWAIDPRHDHGEALVHRLRRIANELLESNGIDVSFAVGPGVEVLKLPMDTRKEIVLLFKEALHNASKYSQADLVQVSLHRRAQGTTGAVLQLSVKDNGCGFDPALHSDGHGLESMKRRARSLGSELILRSAPGLGTLVGVEVDLTGIRD